MGREEVLEELRKLGEYKIDTPEYVEFATAMDALNREMDELSKPSAEGWKILEEETLKSLREKYAEAGDMLEAFLAVTKTTKDPTLQAARGIGVSIAGLLSKDMNALVYSDRLDPLARSFRPSVTEL